MSNYEQKVNNYQKNCETQKNLYKNQLTPINVSPVADKERTYNLIIISKNKFYDIKACLSIEFLFYLKEKGNKLNHFDEEQKQKVENENRTRKKKYKDKINFTGDEIINMLENPQKLYKKDADIDGIFQKVYDKMKDIESKRLKKNNTKISDLKNDFLKIKITIRKLIESYENHFIENKINYKEENKLEKETEDEKENLNNYFEIKSLQILVENKINYYEEIMKDLNDLDDLRLYSENKVDKLITAENKKRKEDEIITIYNIFEMFKEDLKEKKYFMK